MICQSALFQTRNFDGARDHADANSVLVQSGNTHGSFGHCITLFTRRVHRPFKLLHTVL